MSSSPLLQVVVGLVLYEIFVVGVFSVFFVDAVVVVCVLFRCGGGCFLCCCCFFVLFTGSGRWWWFDLIDGS